MKTTRQLLVAATLLSTVTLAQAQFNPGNLVVLQDGTGSGTLSSAGTAIFLNQYTTAGAFVNDVAIPTTGATAIVDSGTASSEGALSLSADGKLVVFGGYNANAGTTGISGAAAATVNRALGTVNAAGIYSLAATTASAYSANNIRGGTSDGLGNFWGAGAANSGGTYYFGTTAAAAQVSAVNSIAVKDLGGNLFYSTAKGTTGIYEIAGTPKAGPVTPTLLLADAAPAGFDFNSGMTIAYVANTTSGIDRFDFNGTAWTLSYTLDSGVGVDSLVADFTTGKIYFTTADGKNLDEVTDTGAGSTINTLTSVDGTTEVLRGVEFTPTATPEPTTFALLGLGALAATALRRRKS